MTTWSWVPSYSVGALDEANAPLVAIGFTPTGSTRRHLARLGMIFRTMPGGFKLFSRILGGSGGIKQTVPVGEVLMTFLIQLKDPGFPFVHMAKFKAGGGAGIYLTNREGAATVRPSGRLTRGVSFAAADVCRIVPRRHMATVNRNVTPAPATLALATAFAPVRALPNVPLPDDEGDVTAAIDLSGAAERAFTLTPTPPDTGPRLVVVDDEAAGSGTFGLLDLYLRKEPGPDPASGRAFTAKFSKT